MKPLEEHTAHAFLRRILDAIQNPVFIKNERHQWVAFNEAFTALVGKSRDELWFKSDFDIFPEDQARIFWEKDNQVLIGNKPNANEEQMTDSSGDVRWLLTIKSPFAFNGLTFLVGVITDITERKRAEAAARVMAVEDALTGLPNRRLLQEHLQRTQAASRRQARTVALIIIDLDDFKHINDTLGHSVGDRFLIEIAIRLRRIARDCDIVARLGGDEFAILATSDGPPEEFGTLAERLVTNVREPVTIGQFSVRSNASVGVAIGGGGDGGGDGIEPDALLAQADLALYASKAAGKNTWCFFEAAMQERAHKLVELEHELHHALDRNEFVLYYQPIFAISDARIIGFEALLRWNNPHRGRLLPGDFLDAVERNRLIIPLTFWTISEAVRQAGAWGEAARDVGVAVNLATSVFEVEGVVEHIEASLAAAGLAPRRLTVEVTEGALVNRSKAVSVLARLRDMGVRVAIDDFGAGHSSLGRLDEIPVDILKIDRMFVAGATPRRHAILRTTIELARNLGLQTVVEGVETQSQYALASRVGADAVQGFYLATPMPADYVHVWTETVGQPPVLQRETG